MKAVISCSLLSCLVVLAASYSIPSGGRPQVQASYTSTNQYTGTATGGGSTAWGSSTSGGYPGYNNYNQYPTQNQNFPNNNNNPNQWNPNQSQVWPCRLTPIPGAPNKYFEEEFGKKWERSCAPGTLLDVSGKECGCIHDPSYVPPVNYQPTDPWVQQQQNNNNNPNQWNPNQSQVWPCRLTPIPGAPNKYFEEEFGKQWERSCAIGTILDVSGQECGCIHDPSYVPPVNFQPTDPWFNNNNNNGFNNNNNNNGWANDIGFPNGVGYTRFPNNNNNNNNMMMGPGGDKK